MAINLDKSVNQEVKIQDSNGVELYIKREDRLHSFISGNKYRKLKYNLEEAKFSDLKTLLTFGGAFSNHIAAVAAIGKLKGYKAIGVIRGEELFDKIKDNATLNFAYKEGMKFKFISREDYRKKTTSSFLQSLKNEFGEFYMIPEGGTNNLAIKGCEEILKKADEDFDIICSPVGTGGTVTGLINSINSNQKVLGFSALKGDFLKDNISKFARSENWELITDYHFGGYAKINIELIQFLNSFKIDFNIPLDPIYTGKMMFGILDMIKNKKFPKGSRILAIHTGGLQGIEGMNFKLKQKKLPLINYKV
ncbi:pyridoxal-phosphate dependent enzyme [Flavobacteriaceae bacterium AU392]|nr:1-aminocyclopropane-1-carboxylate deaminase/D-cysteine desulfhydrase [Flavobacteriaceae bacterium]RKM86971.1 pyridoxal-phosphate dependent enzyme [Flavobacteriaceae bacterium AU392]